MKAEELIKRRRSIRFYKNKKVPRKLIKEILELANLAPTAASKENREFIIINDNKTKELVFRASLKQTHLKEAPVIIAVCTNLNLFKPTPFIKNSLKWGTDFWSADEKNFSKNKRFMKNWKVWKQLWPIQDADTATTTLCLAALSKGLSTCWIGLFEHEKVKRILKIPKNYQVTSLVTLGYQKNPPCPQKRKPIKKLISWNRYK